MSTIVEIETLLRLAGYNGNDNIRRDEEVLYHVILRKNEKGYTIYDVHPSDCNYNGCGYHFLSILDDKKNWKQQKYKHMKSMLKRISKEVF